MSENLLNDSFFAVGRDKKVKMLHFLGKSQYNQKNIAFFGWVTTYLPKK